MKLKTLLILKGMVCLFLGTSLLFTPSFVYGIFGATLTAGGIFAAREYSAAMIGNLMLVWVARNAEASTARRAIVLALCVYDALGVVVTLMAMFSGALNQLAWMVVAIYLFFAIGFGYYLVPERKPLQASLH